MDFVLIWVDGEDPEWRKEYQRYAEIETGDKREVRFRDMGTLKYWFRGVEKFAPWVNKVHFVTCGHYPQWLNLNHPKLNFVKHSDYIPSEYLPTFNSHTIELNLHRIKGLSDEFVYFNDDTFLVGPVGPERFFRDGLPCDMAVLNALSPQGGIMHIWCNNVKFINDNYDKKGVMTKNPWQWFNLRYGTSLLRTFLLMPYSKFTGFLDPHVPNSYLKSTFGKIWEEYHALLDETCKSRFRADTNISQYIMRYSQLVEGTFQPINVFSSSCAIQGVDDSNVEETMKFVKSGKKQIVCINDGDVHDVEFVRNVMCSAFEALLPQKSSFEL